MTHDVIIGCNGVGPIIRQDTITIPHYENGIVTYAVAPPDDMPPKKIERYKKRLERLRYEMLEIIADMTGGEIYDHDGTPHEHD